MARPIRSSVSSTKVIPKPASGPVALLIGTRKGAFFLRSDKSRRAWKLSGPVFLGHTVHHLVLDPRDRRTMLMAARTWTFGEQDGIREHIRIFINEDQVDDLAAKIRSGDVIQIVCALSGG